jgi:hypothetical protein
MLKILLGFLALNLSNSFASTAELEARDTELISSAVVKYFKDVAEREHKPVSLKAVLTSSFGSDETIEDEKELDASTFPSKISKNYILSISDVLKALLPEMIAGKDPEGFTLKAVIWVDAPGHKEKANGFCLLGK